LRTGRQTGANLFVQLEPQTMDFLARTVDPLNNTERGKFAPTPVGVRLPLLSF
jgi:hypothetical protein